VTRRSNPTASSSRRGRRASLTTRVILFATGLTLAAGETFSSVSVRAEDAAGEIHTLPVEYVGEVPGFEWLVQVVVKLPDGLVGAGDMRVSIGLRGETRNKGLVSVR
jgi:uncharacterized protein (TIGR03437 family)